MSSLKPSSRSLALIASVLVLSLSAGYIALAWTEPTGTMPVTVAAPLNTGTSAQTKAGALAIQGNLTAPMLYDADNTAYFLNPAGQTLLAGLQVKNPTGDLVTRFEGLSNSCSSKLYISSSSSGDGGIYYDASGNVMNLFSYGDLRFNVGTGNISGTIANQRMIITQAGNIGIGTASPSGKLQIAGDAAGWPLVIDAANTSNSYNTSVIKRSGQPVIAWGAYPGTWNPAIQIQNEDNSRLIWLSPLGPTSGANARMRAAATGLDFYVGGTTADAGTLSMSLNSDGKVVINNSGQLCIGTACVSSSTWASMVNGAGSSSGGSGGGTTIPVDMYLPDKKIFGNTGVYDFAFDPSSNRLTMTAGNGSCGTAKTITLQDDLSDTSISELGSSCPYTSGDVTLSAVTVGNTYCTVQKPYFDGLILTCSGYGGACFSAEVDSCHDSSYYYCTTHHSGTIGMFRPGSIWSGYDYYRPTKLRTDGTYLYAINDSNNYIWKIKFESGQMSVVESGSISLPTVNGISLLSLGNNFFYNHSVYQIKKVVPDYYYWESTVVFSGSATLNKGIVGYPEIMIKKTGVY